MAPFSPQNYDDARDFLLQGRKKTRRVMTWAQKGVPRDTIYTSGTEQEVIDSTAVIRYKYWDTDIATWYPDGTIRVEGWDSPSTANRMNNMNLPYYSTRNVSHGRAGYLVKDQGGRMRGVHGYPAGIPGSVVVIKKAGRHTNELVLPENPADTVYVPDIDKKRAFERSRRAMLKVFGAWERAVTKVGQVEQNRSWIGRAGPNNAPSPTGLTIREGLRVAAKWGMLEGIDKARWQEILDGMSSIGHLPPEFATVALEEVRNFDFWYAVSVFNELYFTKKVVPSEKLLEAVAEIKL